jgi:hypothetical protein
MSLLDVLRALVGATRLRQRCGASLASRPLIGIVSISLNRRIAGERIKRAFKRVERAVWRAEEETP